jgi:heat shock protein HtpX
MGKRILLFLLSSLAAALTVCVVVIVLGAVGLAKGPEALPLLWVAGAALAWAMGGAMLSLLLSRRLTKKALGVRLLNGSNGDNDTDWVVGCVRRLAETHKTPLPQVGLYDSAEVNSFSVGSSRKRSLVAVSSGLVRNMSRQEMTAVLAHEVSHIANGDMVTMGLLQGVENAFVLALAWPAISIVKRKSRGPLLSAVALSVRTVLEAVLGLAAGIIAARFSRRREVRADTGAAELAGREHMLSALRQLARTRERVDGALPALRCFKISSGGSWIDALATHPTLEKRIAALDAPATPAPKSPAA